MNLKEIKPKVRGKSDKYSWQLYQYLKKNPTHTKVFWNRKNYSPDGTYSDFSEGQLYKSGRIIIGRMHEELIGANLGTIMGQGKNKYQSWCYHPFGGWSNDQFEEITDYFWEGYTKLGRCFLDPQHNSWWFSDDKRFIYVNNTRRCNWCGQWQERKIEKVVRVNRNTVWENQ